MSSTFQKDELTWRDILIRSAIVIITVIVVVWALPHDNISYFYVEEGKPWKYADFTAPFDFPIYKSEKAINEERDSAMRNYEPYYNYNKDTELRMVNKFNTDYADGIPGLPKSFIVIISNRLHSLYQQGIMEQEEYNKLHKDTTQMIRVVNGKEAASISILEVYSAKSAYEQLFTEDQLLMFRPILQKCNLNAYIMPNLIYDRERSETSRNDLLSGIALASGLVQKGEKIVDRGEIVTEKTYRIIESYKRENELRNDDVAQNQISLLGQILYVTILMVCFTLYLTLYRKDYFEKPRSIAMLYTLIIFFVLLTALFMRNTFIHIYIIPYAMVPIFIRVFMDSRTAFMTHTIMVLICATMLQHPYEFIVVELIAGLFPDDFAHSGAKFTVHAGFPVLKAVEKVLQREDVDFWYADGSHEAGGRDNDICSAHGELLNQLGFVLAERSLMNRDADLTAGYFLCDLLELFKAVVEGIRRVSLIGGNDERELWSAACRAAGRAGVACVFRRSVSAAPCQECCDHQGCEEC